MNRAYDVTCGPEVIFEVPSPLQIAGPQEGHYQCWECGSWFEFPAQYRQVPPLAEPARPFCSEHAPDPKAFERWYASRGR